MKIVNPRLLLCVLSTAVSLAGVASNAVEDPMRCPAGSHAGRIKRPAGIANVCVGDQFVSCPAGYSELAMGAAVTCKSDPVEGNACPERHVASLGKDGKKYCFQAGPQLCPGLSGFHLETADGALRCVSNIQCPDGYHLGKFLGRQTMCVGPKGFSCAEGYAEVMSKMGFVLCGSPEPKPKDFKCPDGRRPNFTDSGGQWRCQEPDTDKCPKKGRIGKADGEDGMRCLFAGI